MSEQYTRGEWEVLGELEVETDGSIFFGEPRRRDWFITGNIGGKGGRTIAQIGGWTDRPNAKDDAEHIVALHNACEGLNPEGIPKAIEALKGLNPCMRPLSGGEPPYEWAVSEKAMVSIRDALKLLKEGGE